MRLKTLSNQMRVYMNPNDYRTMIECAESRRAEIAMRCMGEMGLRVSETNFKMEDIRESSHQEVDIVFLTIYGKDSTGKSDDGKRRDVWMPRNLYERLQMYQKNENLSDHHPILPFSTRTISRDVKESAKNAALKTGDEDYNYISCHDFRAYFATNMLLREGRRRRDRDGTRWLGRSKNDGSLSQRQFRRYHSGRSRGSRCTIGRCRHRSQRDTAHLETTRGDQRGDQRDRRFDIQ